MEKTAQAQIKKQRLKQIDKQNDLNDQDTLCWTCQHCTGRASKCFETIPTPPEAAIYKYTTCPWVTHGHPVPGWTAAPQQLKITPARTEQSYFVTACPYYNMAPEARIAQLSYKDLGSLIGVSERYVFEHKSLARQVGYMYVKRMSHFKSKLSPDERITYEHKYKMRKAIMEELKGYAEDAFKLAEEDPLEKPKDAEIEIKQAKVELHGCTAFLRNLETNRKNREKAKAKNKTEF